MLTNDQKQALCEQYGCCNWALLDAAARLGASWAARLCYQREAECLANPATAHLATGYEDAAFAIGNALRATAEPHTPPAHPR